MNALAIVKEAAEAGVQLKLDGDKLKLKAKAQLPDGLLARLRLHKAEIVELLQKTAAIRPHGYTDQQWLDALADAQRLGYGRH